MGLLLGLLLAPMGGGGVALALEALLAVGELRVAGLVAVLVVVFIAALFSSARCAVP